MPAAITAFAPRVPIDPATYPLEPVRMAAPDECVTAETPAADATLEAVATDVADLPIMPAIVQTAEFLKFLPILAASPTR